ncbi:MAG: archease [Candidatus Bathyarchaeia archaeon]
MGKKNPKGYEFLEHVSDAYIMAYGKTLNEAFENAARAMFDVMTDVVSIEPKIEEMVEVKAKDEYELLYNWLEILLIKFDTESMLYSKFSVYEIGKSCEEAFLKAKIYGEPFDINKHVSKIEVKAITFHQMEILKKNDFYTLKFILDL